MTSPLEPPPDDPLTDPRPLVTQVELDRLVELRQHQSWHDLATANDTTSFLLDLVSRLLGRALVPGEDPYRAGEPDDLLTVTSGPNLYVCGHGDWYVRVRDQPGIHASFTAGALDACRLRDLLNGRDPHGPSTTDR